MNEVEHARDRRVVLTHCANKGVQMISLSSAPVIMASLAYRRNLTAARFLRHHARATFLVGPVFGLGAGLGALSQLRLEEAKELTADKARRIEANVLQARCDEYGQVGAVAGALAASLVLRGAPLLWTAAGGASAGVAAGVAAHVAAHVARNWAESTATGAERMMGEVEVALGRQ